HTPAAIANRESWAEWHYFNVLSADRRRWAFLSFIVAGDVPNGRWGGQVLLTLHSQGAPERRFVANVPPRDVKLSTDSANLRIGTATVNVLDDGRYAVKATAREEHSGATATVDLVVTPTPGAYFPGISIGDDAFVSGYTVPALAAEASGSICA